MGQHEILQIILIPTDDPSVAIVFFIDPHNIDIASRF